MELDFVTLNSILQAFNTEKLVLVSRLNRNRCDDLMKEATQNRYYEVDSRIRQIEKLMSEMCKEAA